MKFEIIAKSKVWLAFSAFLCAVSAGLIFSGGLKFGIDYTGGTLLEFSAEISREEIQKTFQETVGADFSEKIVATENGFQIRAKEISPEARETFLKKLKEKDADLNLSRAISVGPTVGAVFKKRAAISLSLAIAAIVLFLAFAFRRTPAGISPWKFGFAAIAALTHDILITTGVFAAIGFAGNAEIDSLFITALLTVMGFSVHDTIVVFDRLRENLKGKKSVAKLPEIAEKSVWQTMARSIYTSVSTLIVLIFLLIFGAPSLFYFVLALTVGISVGTYSSIFLAMPLLVSWCCKK